VLADGEPGRLAAERDEWQSPLRLSAVRRGLAGDGAARRARREPAGAQQETPPRPGLAVAHRVGFQLKATRTDSEPRLLNP
jgi:hypothetical protein